MKNEKTPKKSRKATIAQTARKLIVPAQAFGFMSGFAIGAATMYMFDPDAGDKRRSAMKEQIAGLFGKGREVLENASKNVYEHVEDLVGEAKSALSNVGSMPGVRSITKHLDGHAEQTPSAAS